MDTREYMLNSRLEDYFVASLPDYLPNSLTVEIYASDIMWTQIFISVRRIFNNPFFKALAGQKAADEQMCELIDKGIYKLIRDVIGDGIRFKYQVIYRSADNKIKGRQIGP